MTWYADLGPIDYFREYSFPGLRAVGWLGEGHPFQQGAVGTDFFAQLCVLLLDPWEPVHFLGSHVCELCPWEVPPDPESRAALERARQQPGFRATPSDFQRYRRALLGVRKPPQPIQVGNQELPMGCTNVWIPGDGCIYVAPSLIAHSIRDHRYAPPMEFVNAVLRCPADMHSEEYRTALRGAGAGDLADSSWADFAGSTWWRSQRDQTFKGAP